MSRQVCGVAYLNDAVGKICIVCRNWDTISVFHAMSPYEQLRGIHVNGLQQATDIVACPVNMLLFVADYDAGCVWQVTTGGKVDGRLHTLPVWSPSKRTATEVYPVSLSVRSGRLAVVEENRILICDPHSDKRDEIEFDQLVTVHHAVEKEHHSFIVALTDRSPDMRRSAIRNVEQDQNSGKWIRSREWNFRDLAPPLADIHRPLYMALDTSGCLYVASDNSRRVLVLDSKLNVVRSVCLRKRSMPKRLSFLSHPRQSLSLIVAAGYTVSVYDDLVS